MRSNAESTRCVRVDGLVSFVGNERDRREAYCLIQAAVSRNLLLADCVRVDINVVLTSVFTHTECVRNNDRLSWLF